MQQVGQVLSGEFPLERLGDVFVALLKLENPFRQMSEGKEVVGREDLSLENGEIDFDLVQPTGMDG